MGQKNYLTLLGPSSENPCVFSNPNTLPQVDTSFKGFSVRLLCSKPTTSIPPWEPFPSIHIVGVSATAITSPLGSSKICMSLVHSELFTYIKVSVLNGVFDCLGLFIWVLLKPDACLKISGASVITASLGWESNTKRCS